MCTCIIYDVLYRTYYIGEKMRGNCGCGCGYGMRGFVTKEERLEMLKEYKKELEQEMKGIEEEIKETQKAK